MPTCSYRYNTDALGKEQIAGGQVCVSNIADMERGLFNSEERREHIKISLILWYPSAQITFLEMLE